MESLLIQYLIKELGFPTDIELLEYYLKRKNYSLPFYGQVIKEINLYNFDPWDLPGSSNLTKDKKMYFFTPRDWAYHNGSSLKRLAGDGYWQATSAATIIRSGNKISGCKRSLVFYKGGRQKTKWIMHEYLLPESMQPSPNSRDGGTLRMDCYVLCRVYEKRCSGTRNRFRKAVMVSGNNSKYSQHTRDMALVIDVPSLSSAGDIVAQEGINSVAFMDFTSSSSAGDIVAQVEHSNSVTLVGFPSSSTGDIVVQEGDNNSITFVDFPSSSEIVTSQEEHNSNSVALVDDFPSVGEITSKDNSSLNSLAQAFQEFDLEELESMLQF